MELETEIQQLARQLLNEAQKREPVTLSPAWWQERLLAWATSDPEFRVKLLRFVDVLPSLRDSRAVANHIRQYFRDDTPAVIHLGAELATPTVFRPVVSRVVRQGVFAMAHRFIAGETPEQAVPRLRELAQHGVGYTVDLLGEATLSEQEADVYFERYASLIRTLALQAPGPHDGPWHGAPPVNVSVKLSALSSHFEPAAPGYVSEAVRSRLLPLLRLARRHSCFINIDMEQYQYRDLVQTVFADAVMEPDLRDYADIGIVVQAYLKSAETSIRFLRQLAEQRGTPITVRLVKGAYWDEERIVADEAGWDVPVYEDKAATDASYERCTDLLLDSWPHLRPAFGTHNPRSVAQAIARSRAHGLEAGVEFQMLFGMAETLRDAVARHGFRTRVYVPVGAIIPGMAYLVRRLLENTSNQSWFVKESLDVPIEEIVAAPATRIAATKPSVPVEGFVNTPLARFHEPSTRAAMDKALAHIRKGFGGTQPLLLAHGRHDTASTAQVRAPAYPSLLLGGVAQAASADVEAAVGGAIAAFEHWRDLPASRRASILREAASIMERRRFDLAALMVYESGKPWREADGDVAEACDYLRYYAGEAERLMRPEPLRSTKGEQNVYLREPRGVTAVIAPWNFPLAIITGMTAGAARNRQLRHPQARRAVTADRREAGRGSARGRRARRRAAVSPRPGRRGRPRAGRAPRRRYDCLHRQQGGRARHHPGCGAGATRPAQRQARHR